MKPKFPLIVIAASVVSAHAASLTWDTDPATAGAQGGAGTWTNGTNFWWDGAANANWNNATPDTATFAGGGGGVVTLGSAITAGGLTFDTAGYSLTASTITLNGATVTTNQSATLSSQIISNGLTKAGTGTLVFDSSKTYTGSTTINGGVLELTATGKMYNGAYNNSAVVTVNANGVWRMPNYSYAGVGQLADYRQRRVLNGGTIEVTGTSHSSGQDFTVNATGGTFRYTPAGQVLTLSGNANTNTSISGPLTFDAVGDILVSGTSAIIEGTGSIVKTGSGTLTLATANTYSGATTVNAGKLVVSNTLRNTSFLTANAGGILELGATNLLVTNHGTAVASTRVLTVDGGTVVANASMESRIGNIALRNGGTFTSDRGLASWDVLLANTSAGAATVTVSNTAGNTSPSQMNGTGGIHLQGAQNFVIDDVTGDNTADLAVTLTLADDAKSATTGSLTKSGPGTLRLSNTQTYTGITAVNEGTVLLDGSLKSGVTVADGAVLAISGTGSADAAILVKEGGLLDTTAATGDWSPMNNRTLTAGRTGAAGTDITGNLTLLPGATLQIGEGAATSATLTSASGLKLDGGKVAFDLTSNPAGANDTIVLTGPLDVVSVSDVQFNLTDLALGNGVYPLVSAAGGITGAANITPLGLPGAGARQTFTLSTTTVPNTLTLDVTGSAATLVWNNFSGTGKWNTTDVNWKNGAVNDKFFNGDLVRLEDTANGTENIDIDTTVEGVAIQAANTAATAFVLGGAGKITGSTSISLSGGGILRLANTGGSDFTGAVTVENGSTLEIADPYALPTAAAVTLDGSTLDVGTTTGVLTGPVLLTNGSTLAGTTGTLEAASVEARGGLISANLAGTGTFAVTNNSTAQLESATALSTALGVGAGSTLELLGGAAVTGNIANSGTLRGAALATQTATVAGIVSGGGALQQNGAGTLALTGAQTYSGPTTVNAGVLDLATGDAKLYSDTYRTTTLTINAGGTVRAGRINYSVAGHFGQLTHNCPSSIINGGTLDLVSATDTSGRGWTIGAAGGIIRTAAGSVHTWSPSNETWTQIDLNNGGAALTFDVGGDFVLRSTIMDYTGTPGGAGGVSTSNGSVTKTGPGTLTFGTQTLVAAAGSHKYTGTTAVQQGTLVLDASLGTSPVVVAAGATLSIGTALATVGAGPLTLAATSTLKIEGNSTLQNSDLLNIAGAVDLNGATLNFTDLGNSTLTAGTKFPILTYTGALSGEFAGLPEGGTFTAGSNTFKIRYADESKITLEAVSTGGYATWSAENAPTGTAADDFDGDGVPNGIEYVLGGTKTTNDLGKVPAPQATPGGDFVFSFVRSQASKTPDTTVRIQVGTDLAAWPSSYNVATAPEVTTTDNGNGTETVTLTLPRTPDAKKFGRLSVEIQ
ncbi:MAG: autotransporter-associated beta strand repeat-containing protein [Verrucomicrobia bacterium]|nr:autotransporter-associated beta strand repeat-containing protein [Verrucomicrobiota bacterium]